MSAAVSYERVRDQLATLGLEAALTSLDPVLARGMTLHDLVTKSRAARDRNRLGMFMQMLLRPALLILDEIGYQPLERHDATCLFELVNSAISCRSRSSSRATRASGSGTRFSPTRHSRPRSWTGSSTAPPRSRSAAKATGSGIAARPALPAPRSTQEGHPPPRKRVHFSAVDSVHFQTVVDTSSRRPSSSMILSNKLGSKSDDQCGARIALVRSAGTP